MGVAFLQYVDVIILSRVYAMLGNMSGQANSSSTPTSSDIDVLETFDLTQDALPYLLRRAYARAESLFMEIMCVDDMTPRQITLLTASHQRPGATLSELADVSAVDINTTSQVVKRLIAKGLLERRRSERDRRAYLIYVTSAGEDALRLVLPNNERLADEILEPLPADYRPMFMRCLRLLAGLDPIQPGDDRSQPRSDGQTHADARGLTKP